MCPGRRFGFRLATEPHLLSREQEELRTWWTVEKLHRLPVELDVSPREVDAAMADYGRVNKRIYDAR